ncbi:MAG TPA: DUF4129 domain-containing protein [Pirellulales bacterium]|nr:DUF4129 domain-containing protein [Pirellulales bacterium]
MCRTTRAYAPGYTLSPLRGWPKTPRAVVLGVLLALALWLAVAGRGAAAEPSDGVEEARQALGSSRRFPWYDETEDGLRRVNVKTPWEWNWKTNATPSFNWSWLQVLIWVVAAAMLAGLAYLLIKAYLDREDRAVGEPLGLRKYDAAGDEARIEALPFRIRRGAPDLLGEARRHYAAGNYGEAVIYLFSHELVELDRGRMIRLAKGKTNRQYLRELARRRVLAQLFEQSMVAFEDVFFGNYALQRRRFEECWRRLGEFEALVGEGRAE